MQKLALMMAVMMLGMPPVHGHHVDVGPWAWGDEGSAGLRVHPPILTRESRGTLATREPNGSRVRYGISPREHGGSAALRSLRRIRLESEKVGRMREEIMVTMLTWGPGPGEMRAVQD